MNEEIIERIKKAQRGNKTERDRLVQENIGLVWSIVKRYLNRGYEADDLFQVGSIGLIKAIDKFDSSYEVRFATYAVPMISGEIKRFLRDDGMIKVSRTIKEHALKIYKAKESYRKKYGEEPTLEKLMEMCRLTQEDVLLAMDSSNEVESLETTIFQGDGAAIRIIDRLEGKQNMEEEIVQRFMIEQLCKELTQQEKTLLYLRYFEERTQSYIAELFEISQVQVSRMEKKVLLKLRKESNKKKAHMK